jgi:hypothetical protein
MLLTWEQMGLVCPVLVAAREQRKRKNENRRLYNAGKRLGLYDIYRDQRELLSAVVEGLGPASVFCFFNVRSGFGTSIGCGFLNSGIGLLNSGIGLLNSGIGLLNVGTWFGHLSISLLFCDRLCVRGETVNVSRK